MKLLTNYSLPQLVVIFFIFAFAGEGLAHPEYQVAATITLEMHVLVAPNGAHTDQLCNVENRRAFGCTFHPNNPEREYPFSSNTITINIESDERAVNENDTTREVELGYLPNVVPQELSASFPLSALTAQAIASRTTAYWDIEARNIPGSPLPSINNSTQFQAYIPYFYDTLADIYQARVDQAIAERVYMSLPDDPAPIHAHFGQDVMCQMLRDRPIVL